MSLGTSVAPRGALTTTKVRRTNVVGTPVTSAAKTAGGTPMPSVYLLSFEVIAGATIVRITPVGCSAYPGAADIAVGTTHSSTLIRGVDIVFGGTINNKDYAYIEVLADEDEVGRWEISQVTTMGSSTQIKAAPGTLGFAHLMWTGVPASDFVGIFYDNASADSGERFRLNYAATLYPYLPNPADYRPGGLDFVNGIRIAPTGSNVRLLVGWI